MQVLQASTTRWPFPLHAPPRVLQMGIGIHGRQRREKYCMHDLWCVHLYRYHATLRINGEVFPIQPGSISIVPPGTLLEYSYRGLSVHAYAHFRLQPKASEVSVPAMQNWGEKFAALNGGFEEAIAAFSTQPERAVARLWDVLWQLTEYSETPTQLETSLHPAVAQAVRMIELRLAEPISVAELAQHSGISHNHLTRLFQAEMKASVVGYIRQRRMQRAQHLLTQTTLPVKVIAAQVGIPDLHAFNKTVRREFGVAPRSLRRHLL
jgi:AraC-like DNA-binding protein